jgi:hypothetical protein
MKNLPGYADPLFLQRIPRLRRPPYAKGVLTPLFEKEGLGEILKKGEGFFKTSVPYSQRFSFLTHLI